MPDLIWLLNQLVDAKGNIMIPGIMDSVAPLDPEEAKLYKDVDFCANTFQSEAGVRCLRFPGDKVCSIVFAVKVDDMYDVNFFSKMQEATLMNRWRFPSLSIHGIEGAFADPGSKTVIPRKVIGKFSIRLVPNQDPVHIEKLVRKYLNDKWAERGSGNKMTVSQLLQATPVYNIN